MAVHGLQQRMPGTDLRRRTGPGVGLLATVLSVVLVPGAAAVGTDAGTTVTTTARADFAIDGAAQPPVFGHASFTVDELLDVVVVNDDAGAVPVVSPQPDAVLSFTVTNTGNGSERFQLIVEDALTGGDFIPADATLWLESNGEPGLQTGAGGDTLYIAGDNDPELAADDSLTVYLIADIPTGLAGNAEGLLGLRAIATTLATESGTDDPESPSFPEVGTTWAGAGDVASGGAPVAAMVGPTHAPENLQIRAAGRFQVTAETVALTKNAVSFTDPRGGTTLVPGTVIDYEIVARVNGTGVEDLVVTDLLPRELEFITGSVSVAGTDSTLAQDSATFDPENQALRVPLGDVTAGQVLTVSYSAAVRQEP